MDPKFIVGDTTQTFTIPAAGGRQELKIYAIPANINYFLKTALTPDVVQGPTNAQVAVKAFTRRQYPGDPTPINVSGATREYLIDPTRKVGNALPGRTVVLVADAGTLTEERRAFTYSGRWMDFHSWLRSNAKMEIRAYNNGRTRSTIPAAGTTP